MLPSSRLFLDIFMEEVRSSLVPIPRCEREIRFGPCERVDEEKRTGDRGAAKSPDTSCVCPCVSLLPVSPSSSSTPQPTMSQTIFEKIVAGSIPCYKLYEDEHVLSFLDIFPANRVRPVSAL